MEGFSHSSIINQSKIPDLFHLLFSPDLSDFFYKFPDFSLICFYKFPDFSRPGIVFSFAPDFLWGGELWGGGRGAMGRKGVVGGGQN